MITRRLLDNKNKNILVKSLNTLNKPEPRIQGAEPLNWQEFLAIRKSRHRYDNVASIPTTLTGFFGGASYFSTLDPGQIIFGIEAVWVYSFASLGCGALGWLTGPTLGTAIWKFLHKAKLPEYEIKERVFYHHIMKNRVDPARQSVQNPVPDYYGENVYSLQTYRQWLRDQATYNRKAYLSENE